MNDTLKVQICQRQPGSCQAMTTWHGSRLSGDVDSIF
jgi:hypothetical protein